MVLVVDEEGRKKHGSSVAELATTTTTTTQKDDESGGDVFVGVINPREKREDDTETDEDYDGVEGKGLGNNIPFIKAEEEEEKEEENICDVLEEGLNVGKGIQDAELDELKKRVDGPLKNLFEDEKDAEKFEVKEKVSDHLKFCFK